MGSNEKYEQVRKAVEEHLHSVLSQLGDIIVSIGEDFDSIEDVLLDIEQDGTVKLTIGGEHLRLQVHVINHLSGSANLQKEETHANSKGHH